jgi:plasmid stabilization system protein ParE
MNIRLLDAAKDDLRSGWSFYERQISGLGNTFLAAIDSDVQTLALYAGTHLKLAGFYRMLIKRFPFALYYLVNESSIDIYAILDCRRDPIWIRDRLAISPPPP